MNKPYFTGLFIMILMCCSASISYACNPTPTAIINEPNTRYVSVGETVYFYGDYPNYSHDNDEGGIRITAYDWDFPQADEITDGDTGRPTAKWNSPGGPYEVELMVKDNEGQWSISPDTCTVYVIKVNLDIVGMSGSEEDDPGRYIAVNTDDDNKNSTQDRNEHGTVDDEDDLVEISLSIEPNMPEGYIKLEVGYFGLLSAWEEPTKGTSVIDPTEYPPKMEAIWNLSEGSFPETLWVEAYFVHNNWPCSGFGLYYSLNETMAPTIDSDEVRFNPVEVQLFMDGVNEDDEEFSGNYILYNKDDDDDDGLLDFIDYNNPDEDDLVRINPGCVQPTLYITGTVTFDVTSGDSKVKVWEPNEYYPAVKQVKYKEITLPVTYNTPINPLKKFYVEGIEPSGGPRDVEFTLTYIKDGLTFEDKVKVTVVHVELFIDSAYTQPLDDWPKEPDNDFYLRSPKYMFGKKDPIYVQVNNIGIDPDVAETKYDVIFVDSQSGGPIYMDLKETGVNTEIFRNSIADRGELLYLSTVDVDDYPVTMDPDKITVSNEEVLDFYLSLPPVYGMYKRSVDVMVDRAEIGVEWQREYLTNCRCNPRVHDVAAERFGEGLFNNIGGEPNLVWYKNFDCNNFDSKPSHWKPPYDTAYADSVDMASWSGHNNYKFWGWHFFIEDSACIGLEEYETNLGDQDADWLIFDTCYSLDVPSGDIVEKLKDDLLTSGRCAHMFLGFKNNAHWDYPDCGEYFADLLEEGGSIRQAWFDYCRDRQRSSTKVRVFYAAICKNESLAGPGPIYVRYDPTKDNTWAYQDYPD